MEHKLSQEELIICEDLHPYITEESRHCLCCGTELDGRADKKFCNTYCRSQYHYQQSKKEEPDIYNHIKQQLNQNRKILAKYNKAGKAYVRESLLRKEGFNPKVFTHYWRNQDKKLYLFVFEYGFMRVQKNGVTKLVLIQWQPYMSIK